MVEERNACTDIKVSTEGINIQKIFYFSNQKGGKDIAIAAANVEEADRYLRAFHKSLKQRFIEDRFRLTSVFASAMGLAAIVVEDFCNEIVNEDTREALLEFIDEGGE